MLICNQFKYQAARIVTGAWKGISIERLYNILGWESMQNRRTMRKLCLMYEITNEKSPRNLYKVIETQNFIHPRQINKLHFTNVTTNTNKFKKSFFPASILDWNKLDFDIKIHSQKMFLKNESLIKFARKRPLILV